MARAHLGSLRQQLDQRALLDPLYNAAQVLLEIVARVGRSPLRRRGADPKQRAGARKASLYFAAGAGLDWRMRGTALLVLKRPGGKSPRAR
jgi:hypothetical protein